MAKRTDSNERYVLDLVSEVLDVPYYFRYCSPTLWGDSGKPGRQARLPVDWCFSSRGGIIKK